MTVTSQQLEKFLQLKVSAQAKINCLEEDSFDIEIEEFQFDTELQDGSSIESAHLRFSLTNVNDPNERVIVEVTYDEIYPSMRSMFASRDCDKTDYIDVVEIETASEKRREYLCTVAEDLTRVDILMTIEN